MAHYKGARSLDSVFEFIYNSFLPPNDENYVPNCSYVEAVLNNKILANTFFNFCNNNNEIVVIIETLMCTVVNEIKIYKNGYAVSS